jgi:hypothetical protein
MLDIIPGSFGIYGGAPSAQWRGEDLVRGFEPREPCDVLVAGDIGKFGAEWRGGPKRIRAERR